MNFATETKKSDRNMDAQTLIVYTLIVVVPIVVLAIVSSHWVKKPMPKTHE